MKTKKFLIIAAIAGAALAGCSKDKHVEPDGSQGNPFIVKDAATLKKVGSGTDGWDLTKHYLQTANISLNATETWIPIGIPPTGFTGSYDGGGYSITGLNIPATTTMAQGLFSTISFQGVVRNVALINVNIYSTNEYPGGIAGGNYGIIENCYVTGNIRGNGGDGGIAGYNRGEIKNCYTTCTVTNNGVRTGGIVGDNGGKIQNCYATGKITGTDYVGGIVGNSASSSATVQSCVALNIEVSATNATGNVGRVVGNNSGGAMIDNYARAAGMTLKRGSATITPTEATLTGKDGANVAANYTHGDNSAVWWANGCDTKLWNLAPNRLPHLRTTEGKEFKQPQNPEVLW